MKTSQQKCKYYFIKGSRCIIIEPHNPHCNKVLLTKIRNCKHIVMVVCERKVSCAASKLPVAMRIDMPLLILYIIIIIILKQKSLRNKETTKMFLAVNLFCVFLKLI